MRSIVIVVSVLALAAGCASNSAPAAKRHTKPEENAILNSDDALSSEAYAAKVAEAGGRVDFVFGDDRPFAQCHASTVVETGTGDLLCAWFGGTEEKDPDVGIWESRFTGGAWTYPERAAKVGDRAHWNPVLFRDRDGNIYLFFKVGVDVIVWETWYMKSGDGGKTWTEPVELAPGDIGGRGPVKNKPIILSDGTWLAPASTEHGKDFEGRHKWLPFADISTDQGKTWQRTDDWAMTSEDLKGIGAIQPTFWESSPGHVHALMRTSMGRVWRADSTDYGKTWGEVYRTALPNNNSGLDVLMLDDGRLLLVFNPVPMNWGPRTPLDLAVSTDNGHTWRVIAHLEDDPDKDSEYSYPAIVETDGGVAVTYTWQRQRVRCWQIPLDALE